MTNEEREAMREYIDALVELHVQKAFASLDREALRGPAGPPGERGEKGVDGRDGDRGVDGKDGRDADLEPLRKELREEITAMRAEALAFVKAIPAPRDGKDGIGKHEIHEAVRAAVAVALPDAVAAAARDEVKAVLTDNPLMTFKGVWTEGTEYQPGNTVQYGGSVYHCDRATTAKPDAHFNTGRKGDWTLAVKKGRDGKDARDR